MPDPSILIIADDLSGAADCGVACANAGLDTVVVIGNAGNAIPADVIAIDADTRRLPAVDAAAAIAHLVREHAQPGQILFKKLDSTLRGNVGAELAAALHARRALCGDAVAIVAPAFPGTGRTTRDGHQLLNGARLEHTDVWRAEAIAGCAHLPTLLTPWTLRAAAIPLDTVRQADHFEATLAALSREHDALVCDAEDDADLRRIATAVMRLGRNTLWVGSAGLAHHLPFAAGLQRCPARMECPTVEKPILFVVGSASSVSRQQAERLSGEFDVAAVLVPPGILREGEAAWTAIRAATWSALADGQDVLVALAPEATTNLAEGSCLARALGALVLPLASHCGALVMTGGETARAVLQAVSVDALRLIGEIEVGVPVSMTKDGLVVVTKAGAFGRADTLVRCRTALRPPGIAFPVQEETNP